MNDKTNLETLAKQAAKEMATADIEAAQSGEAFCDVVVKACASRFKSTGDASDTMRAKGYMVANATVSAVADAFVKLRGWYVEGAAKQSNTCNARRSEVKALIKVYPIMPDALRALRVEMVKGTDDYKALCAAVKKAKGPKTTEKAETALDGFLSGVTVHRSKRLKLARALWASRKNGEEYGPMNIPTALEMLNAPKGTATATATPLSMVATARKTLEKAIDKANKRSKKGKALIEAAGAAIEAIDAIL